MKSGIFTQISYKGKSFLTSHLTIMRKKIRSPLLPEPYRRDEKQLSERHQTIKPKQRNPKTIVQILIIQKYSLNL